MTKLVRTKRQAIMQSTIRNIKRKKRKEVMYYLSIKEKKDLILECGDPALILFEFYISKGGFDNYIFTDVKSSTALGWSSSKAKKVRLRLEQANYIYTVTYTHKGDKFIVTFLGKENVREAKSSNNIPTDIKMSETINRIEPEQPFSAEEEERKFNEELTKGQEWKVTEEDDPWAVK